MNISYTDTLNLISVFNFKLLFTKHGSAQTRIYVTHNGKKLNDNKVIAGQRRERIEAGYLSDRTKRCIVSALDNVLEFYPMYKDLAKKWLHYHYIDETMR